MKRPQKRGVSKGTSRYCRGRHAIDKAEEQWALQVKSIEDKYGIKAAIKVACVVWWDFVGNRPFNGVVSPLRKWISQYRYDESTEPEREELVECLVEVGYSRERAEYRANRPRMSMAARSIEREHEVQNTRRRDRGQGIDGHESGPDAGHQEDPGPSLLGSFAAL